MSISTYLKLCISDLYRCGIQNIFSEKKWSHHDANFVVIGDICGCHHDFLWRELWLQKKSALWRISDFNLRIRYYRNVCVHADSVSETVEFSVVSRRPPNPMSPQTIINPHPSLSPPRHLNGGPSLQGRHNGRDAVSNYQPYHCLLNRLFRRGSKKTSEFRQGCHRQAYKISLIFQWYFKTIIPNFHDNSQFCKMEKHRTCYEWSPHTSYDHYWMFSR